MKLNLLLLLGLIIANLNYCDAQVGNNGMGDIPYVDRLCYTESSTNRIRVTSELDPTTLTTPEKIKFLTKEYVNNHVEYINTGGYTVHDVYTVSHKNIYPKWYTKAYLIRKSNEGTYSYYTVDSEYLTGGWVGANTTTTANGTYATDSRTGENYYLQDYTSRALELYQRYNNAVISYGALYRHRWYFPTTTITQQFQSEGFTVTFDNNILTIKNPKITMVWDDVKKKYIIQIIENDAVIKTTTYNYEYVDEFENFLLAQTIKSIPQVFDNGDCYTDIEIIKYTDYNYCSTNGMRANENNNAVTKAEKRKSFVEMGYSISPNPVMDRLTISLPIVDGSYTIMVSDISGKILLQRNVNGNSSSFDINTSFFAKGTYVLKVQQGQDIYSTKFVKQ